MEFETHDPEEKKKEAKFGNNEFPPLYASGVKARSDKSDADNYKGFNQGINPNNQQKGTKLPPINFESQNSKSIFKLIKSKHNEINFYIKKINNNKIALFANNSEQHKIIINLPDKEKINYYSDTRKEDKIQTWLLKGIGQSYTEEEIKEEN